MPGLHCPERFPEGACLHRAFAEQAARAPGAVAVLFRGEALAYGELERGANRLAHLLRRRGVGPETRVGVCMERGIEATVALLGILKAGGAYVPVEPSHPAGRLREVFADAGVSLVLTHAGSGDGLPAGVAELRLDDPATRAELDAAPGHPPCVPADPRQLAYVVYTSGSTGRPKGVAVPHGAVTGLVRGTDYLPFGPGERIAQVSSLAFDAATFEVWGALLNGGSLAVVEREATLSPSRFAAELRARRVTAVFVTTALFNRIAHDEPGAFRGVRHVLFGGEAVDPGSVRRVLEAGGPERLLHVYGPTETTTFASWHPVRRVEPGAATVPIGGALANTALHVLDDAGEPVPPGVPGELFVGGPRVARGYLGAPEPTAERFVPDPFGGAGGRLYRTGDRVRRLPAGELEYLGRLDAQVKVRGFRIEPGEIEAALLREPGVREAVVVAREDVPGEKRLVAYVVPAEGAGPAPAELRERLSARLPGYMVPSAVVPLERLPLNANGKVDRGALPAPGRGTGAARVAPRTGVEEALCAVWAEVLGLEEVGVEDGFLELGGHSLLAAQVVSRAREAFGVELPLGAVFEAPTVARLAEVVEGLLRGGAEGGPPLVPAARDRPVPLSFAQEAIWFLQQLSPGMRAYNFQAMLRVSGPLDVAVLERALEEIVRRHEVFRTTFPAVEGRPVQRVHGPWAVRLPPVDLSGVPEDRRGAAVRAHLAEEIARPFDPARLPLVRWTLLRAAPDEHVLACVEHHFVHDGWSFGVFLRELKALYEAFLRGGPSPLPPLPVQYADYAVWQRAWIGSPAAREHLEFWRRALAGAPPLLELPTDRPRPPVLRFRGDAKRVRMPAPLARAARAFAREHGATLYATMLAGFYALLGRSTGAEDVCVGGAVAARGRRETEGLIGMIVNIVALRADLSGDPSFAALLERVRGVAREAFTHQEIPFSRVAEALRPERALDHLPVYQVAFSFHDSPYPEPTLGPARVEVVEGLPNGSTKFDLQVVVIPRAEQRPGASPEDVELIWEYDTDLFDAATLVRFVERYGALLEGALSRPDTPLSALPFLTGGERAQLAAWNATAEALPGAGETLHGLVAAQAARTPDAVAVVGEGGSLTYAGLHEWAEGIARLLRERGVGPETRVGVCMERSPALVAALLGVLRAGGAYVPLDPSYPAERLAYMLADSAVPVLLSEERLRGRVPGFGGEVVLLDGGLPAVPSSPPGPPPPACGGGGASPDNLAYVIYTSGSTGRPKGAMNAHRGVVNRLLWMQRRYGLAADDVVLQKTPFGFDVSVWELFWPLVAGARLVLARPDGHRDPRYLSELVEREGVTTLHFVPSMLQAFLEAGEPGRCRSVRRVVCSGEALGPELRDRCLERLPGAELHNLYGPTEAAVDVTAHACERGRPTVPIGRPVANTRVHVLDGRLGETPVGIPGELYIGGVQVGRGYLGRPELTAERFVPDPFGAPGARLYRTGDRARWLATGEVEFLGRTDEQVKVRGFRLEPGEIESALLRHPSVADAAVVAREDGPGGRRLVGYVVARGGARPDAAGLRAHLAASLPEHMVPSAFVLLDALPLTPSGKLDRRALPAPGAPAAPGEPVAPRDEAEATLARIWRELLRLDSVGVHDNFFELGGDSILGIQVVARAGAAGLRLAPDLVFRHQTIAGLAAAAERAAPPRARGSRGEAGGEVPLTPVQRWLFAQEAGRFDHWNQARLVRPREPLDAASLRGAVDALQRHHDALRLRFRRGPDGGWRQWYAPAGDPAPVHHVDLAGPSLLDARPLDDVQASLDLAAGPIFRVVLLDLGARGQRCLLAVHHLAVDGVSWRVLLEDLETAYRQLRRGEPVRLPPRTASYRDWAERLAGHASSPALRREAAYWRGVASGPAHPLPRDLGGENTEGGARVVSVALTEEETRALLREVPPVYRTQVNDVLLAALARAFAAWTGEPGLLVELEGHGREPLFDDLDLSRTVGWFTSVFPVRLEAAPGEDPGATLRATKERLRAVPGKGIGYGVLRYLAGEEGLRVDPEVSFNYAGRLDAGAGDDPLFAPAEEAPGATRHPGARRRCLLDVVAAVAGGRLQVRWHYGAGVHRRETVRALAERYAAALREIVAHCRLPEAGGCTPSDFPLAGVTGEQLEAVAAAVGAGAGGRGLEDLYPLTPMQEGMLFHGEVSPGTYFEQFVYPLRGELDPELLRRAWERVVARHPALRTALVRGDLPGPLQAVLRSVPLPWEALDRRGVPEDRRRAELEAYLRADRERGFDPARAPLLRVALLRWADDAWEMVWSFHHVLLDGWSAARVAGEVAATYRALRAGREAVLPSAAGHPFREYVAWARGRDRAATEAFWRAELRGFTRPTPLPPGRPAGGAVPAGHGDVRLALPPGTAEALAALARRRRLTPSTLVRGAWALLLARGSGEDDVLFGATVSGRPPELPGVEERVGMFVNTLPVRVRVPADEPAWRWLQGLQARQAEMRRFEHTPLAEAQRWSEVPPGTPLFESLLVFESYPADPALASAEGGLAFGAPRSVERTGYPLTVVARPGSGLALGILFDPGRFDGASAERILGGLASLLGAIAADPERRVGALALPPAGGTAGLPFEWATERPPSAPPTSSERALLAVWTEALGRAPSGLDDDFLALGGDSLAAARVVARVRSRLGAEISLRDVLDAAGVAGLAARIAAARPAPAPPPVPAPPDGATPFPLTPAQERALGGAPPVAAVVPLSGPLDAGTMRLALEETVRRHEALRVVLRETEDGPAQLVLPPGGVELPLEEVPRGRLQERMRSEVRRPFDPRGGPLLRARLFRVAPAEHVLLLVAHPLAADGASLGVLRRELRALYAALSRGAPSSLPEPRVRYAGWAARRHARPAAARGPRAWFRAGSVAAAVPRDLADGVRALALRERATPFMALLAAWRLLLGPEPVAVAVSGRGPDTEELVGPLADTVPLRIDAPADASFRTLLARTRQATLDALSGGEAPRCGPPPRTAITWLATAGSTAEALGRRLVRAATGGGATERELSLEVGDSADGGLSLTLEYAAERFAAETAAALAAELVEVLRRAVADPEAERAHPADAPYTSLRLPRGRSPRNPLQMTHHLRDS